MPVFVHNIQNIALFLNGFGRAPASRNTSHKTAKTHGRVGLSVTTPRGGSKVKLNLNLSQQTLTIGHLRGNHYNPSRVKKQDFRWKICWNLDNGIKTKDKTGNR